MFDGAEIVAEASSGEAAIRISRVKGADLALVPYVLADMDGIQLIRTMLSEYPNMRVLMLSSSAQEHVVIDCLRAGAYGFVCKTQSSAMVVEAVNAIAAGGFYICPAAALCLAAYIRRGSMGEISPRERSVLEMIAGGLSNKDMAERLTVRISTIGAYRKALYRKLNVRSAGELVSVAVARGILAGPAGAE